MTPKQEKHLEEIQRSFSRDVKAKYELGQKEHGGDLWTKKHIIDFLIEEAIDSYVYAITLKKQIEDSGVELGEKEE
jgi:hypothetical protein